MIYIVVPNDQSKRLTFYLATEEYIARHLPPQEYFFIWQVNPTVIFGRNQLIDTEVNLDSCRKNNINLFRRKSGGGCVYADQGNLMLACITPERQVGFTFQRYTQRIVTLLNQLGVKAVASGRNDISVDQKKISGNAFYKVGIQNIVHGTLLFDTDLDQLEQAITPSQSKLISKGVQSVRQRVTNLSNYLDMDLPSFKHYLRTQLCADREIVLDDRDLEIIKEMEQEYLDPQFIQGKNPPYQIIRQKRTRSAGEITAKIELKKQTIKSIHLHGDFFAPCSLEEEIYPLLLHQPYEPNKITAIINKIDIGKYILNLSNQEFINLLFEEDTPLSQTSANTI